PKEATTGARSIAPPSVHTFLDAMSEAWRQLLSGGFNAPSADTTPVSATVVQHEGCETKQQRRRGLELWDLLRRKYKIAALRIMRARREVEPDKMHKVCAVTMPSPALPHHSVRSFAPHLAGWGKLRKAACACDRRSPLQDLLGC